MALTTPSPVTTPSGRTEAHSGMNEAASLVEIARSFEH
jgi:hypothetical protein